MTPRTVIVAGLVTVDTVYRLDRFPVEGTKNRTPDAVRQAGGGGFLAAAAIAALGGRAMLIARVGDDPNGDFVLAEMDRLGIDRSLVERAPGIDTPHSAVLLTGDGERTIINRRDPALFTEPPVGALPRAFDAALSDTRWPAAGRALFAAARALGCPRVVDGEAHFNGAEGVLAAASHLAFSAEGLAAYRPGPAPEAAQSVARTLGAWVAVTRGDAPVLTATADGIREVPGFAVPAEDTLGAGDAWHGAFALALAEGQEAEDAVLFANAAAAILVSRRGPHRWARRDEVLTLLEGR